MSSKPRYSYAPLSSLRHTRLVTLHPSETDNYPINCSLVEVNIDEDPKYEALSYTWNDEVPSKPLEIIPADDSGTKSLLITTNCARALRLLRKRVKEGSCAKMGVWVDAISINQSSNEERNAQVSMMAEIYRKARNVVVWLGNFHAPPNRISMLPFHFARPFCLYDKDERVRVEKLRWVDKVLSAAEPVVRMMVETGGASALRLFNSPYWKRAWTLQEFPHSSARILCLNGQTSSIFGLVPSKVLDAAMEIHLHHLLLEMSRRATLGAARPRLLSMNVPYIIELECSEPRDKVFALRELFPSVLGGIAVDYNRPVEDIFTEATSRLILASCSLEALYSSCACKKLYDDWEQREKPYNIPSWAIDWTGGPGRRQHRATDGHFQNEMSWFSASILKEPPYSGPIPRAWISADRRVLKLWGKSFGQVSKCVSERITYDVGYSRMRGEDFVRIIRKFLRQVNQTKTTSESPIGSDLVNILRVACSYLADRSKKDHRQMETEYDVERICELLRPNSVGYWRIMHMRRFFVSTDGKMGLGNSDVRPGDLICSFEGLNMPFVVRKKRERNILVSPAVVVGAMRREMWPEDQNEIVPWEIV